MKEIFISHSSKDKNIADIFVEFLIAVGVPRDAIFCSSLPGNDVKEQISTEIRESLDKSLINIVILSKSYYESAYCLNEAGIIWYKKDISIVIIGLPEITPEKMEGFLNKDYKIRYLSNHSDISAIFDVISQKINLSCVPVQTIAYQCEKLIKKYNEVFISKTVINLSKSESIIQDELDYLTTDDERIILYYLIFNGIRKTCKNDVYFWLKNNELFNINIDNGFDLLNSIGHSKKQDDKFELDIDCFRRVTSQKEIFLSQLKPFLMHIIKNVQINF